jgi:hypothetical protein
MAADPLVLSRKGKESSLNDGCDVGGLIQRHVGAAQSSLSPSVFSGMFL